MAFSPTQLTLKNMRGRGYLSQVVEHWNAFAHIRVDLFGVIDVLGVGNRETLAVQCTSDSHVAERVKKITDCEAIGALREANWRIEVHGWKKVKNRWQVRIVDLS